MNCYFCNKCKRNICHLEIGAKLMTKLNVKKYRKWKIFLDNWKCLILLTVSNVVEWMNIYSRIVLQCWNYVICDLSNKFSVEQKRRQRTILHSSMGNSHWELIKLIVFNILLGRAGTIHTSAKNWNIST